MPQPVFLEQGFSPVPQGPGKPLADRNAKTHLGPFEQRNGR